MNNNTGYEYQIVKDNDGTFIEIYPTDKLGKRGEMHLSIFVNTNEGETINEAIDATGIELFDPIAFFGTDEPKDTLARKRSAFEWFSGAYTSIQEIMNSKKTIKKEIYIITNVYFEPEKIVDEVYSKMLEPRMFEYNGRKVWLGEDSKRVIMPRGVSYKQAEELAESLMNLDFIHSYQVIEAKGLD